MLYALLNMERKIIMYSMNVPKIKETLSLGNDIIGLKIIDISTTDSENHTRQQKEA